MADFNVDEFIESPNVDQLKKLSKDQLLELAEHLGVQAKKCQNKSVIYAKIFKYFVSEGLFEDTDKAKGSISSLDLEIKKLELQMQLQRGKMQQDA